MKIRDLNNFYDELQKEYGAPELSSIYNGGCEKNPDICFVFMNPTGKNIASLPDWKGRRSPWIGTKNIWKLFYRIGLINKDIYNKIQNIKGADWTTDFANEVYNEIENNNVYITNLGKCTQIDARPLPDWVLREYLELLYKEIEIVKPKIIITFGNQVSSIFLQEKICVASTRKRVYKKTIGDNEYSIYPVYYPIGNGMRNIDLAVEDICYILKDNNIK